MVSVTQSHFTVLENVASNLPKISNENVSLIETVTRAGRPVFKLEPVWRINNFSGNPI